MKIYFTKDILQKLLLLLFICMSLSLNAQNKRALVIGLGEQEDRAWGRINGDKDVTLINEILKKSGYSDITNLINRNATKRNIVNSLSSLTRKCKKGDIVYIHFSGHGQQMNDFNKDEADNLDECWIPYDAYMKCCKKDDGSRHLTDDEINSILHKIKTKVGHAGKVLVVVDACHSGDSSRGEDDETYRGTRDRFYAAKEMTPKIDRPSAEQWIILTACRDYQRNAEVRTSKGQYGKLSYALYTLLKDEHKQTNDTFYRQLCRFFDKNRGALQQTPVMSGAVENFKITDIF